jgi:hypothetical protein
MAVGIYKLPICDSCGLPWLPNKWKPSSDPRDPKRPLRCGKCKSSGWDREHNAESRKEVIEEAVETVSLTEFAPFHPVNPENLADVEAAKEANRLAEYVKVSVPRGASRCRHRLDNCPMCNPPEAA